MANVQISQLPAAGSITGTELVPVVQNGVTVQTTTGAIAASPSQTQTFVTVNQEPSLPNSRAISGGTGVGVTDNGAQSTIAIGLNGVSGSLETAGNGMIAKVGGTAIARTIAATGAGLTVTNGDGQSGAPTIGLSGLPLSLAGLSGSGILALPNNGTVTARTITATADQTTVTNGDGASGNPTIGLANNPILPGTASTTLPIGDTAQRGTAANGQIRYNTDTSRFEGYQGGSWYNFGRNDGTVTQVTGTPNQIGVVNQTTTPVVSIVDDPILPGLEGVVLPVGTTAQRPISPINGTLRYNTSTATFEGYANSAWGAIIAGSGVTSVGTGVGLLGGPITSTGTIDIDTTVVATLSGTQTLTNKTISGASNTLSNIGNSSLTNSSLTLGTTTVSLGATATSLAGLSSVAVTGNPTTALELTTKQYVDNIVASGVSYHTPVRLESPDTAGNLNATYNNGTAGVGATLTNAGTQVALTIDGVATIAGDRVLIYNQTNAAENGVYTVTDIGSGSTNWVLTRATDADSYGVGADALDEGSAFFVTSGNTGAGETYVCNTSGTITFGTTPITFAQISAVQVYTAGTGLTLTGTQFSLTAPVTAALGGTGQSSYTTGDLIYASGTTALSKLAAGTNGYLLTMNAGLPSWQPAPATGVTTISFDTTGLTPATATNGAVTVGGTLVAANGGTGQSSYTTGDLLYASGSTAISKLGVGTNGYILTVSGGLPSWQPAPASGVTSFQTSLDGLTPSTGTTGAVTLAGTLGVASGGTGLTSVTANRIPYGNGTSALQTSANLTFDGTTLTTTGLSDSGNLTFTSTGNRIVGDFTNATTASQVAFQTSTANSNTTVNALPSGTGALGGFRAFNSSDANNAGYLDITASSTQARVRAGITGTGSYLPLTFATNNTEQVRIDTSGNVGIGTATPAVKFAVSATDAILVPVGTTAQRPTGATGYIRYNSDTGGFEGYSGSSWGSLGGGNTTTYGLWENNATISANYTITAGNNAMSAGPITVASGVVVTVPSGSTWTIV